jgi:putative flippase GtrA
MRAIMARLRASYARVRHIVHDFLRFGVVGSVAFVVDVTTFNLLLYAGGSGPLHGKPLLAKTIAVVLATTVAFFGNRYWTFRHRPNTGLRREYLLFIGFSAIGLGIALACLYVSHYVFGFTSPIGDNIAANVVGLTLGAAFRFWSYRSFVFPALVVSEDVAAEGDPLHPHP